MKPISDLRHAIGQWDGKSAALMRQIYDANCKRTNFTSTLAALLSEQDYQRGASWLLKHHIDNGHAVKRNDAQTCYTSLNQLTHWDTHLHILQAMHALPIDATHKAAIHSFLTKNVTSKRTLVRAWSYTGFVILARQYEEYHAEAQALLKQAKEVETAGSIKVRIRKGLEELAA